MHSRNLFPGAPRILRLLRLLFQCCLNLFANGNGQFLRIAFTINGEFEFIAHSRIADNAHQIGVSGDFLAINMGDDIVNF